MLTILLTTILKRPYVAAFLLSYLFIARRVTNWRWTAGFILVGYGIAFTSEWLSIHYGIPYGWYFYIYENLKGEWLNNGVPVWDSASYVFMNFAGLCAARIFLRRYAIDTFQKKLILVATAALFVTLLDVVVDPAAHLGEHWFLGKIYYYPNPGPYFDVTLQNFAGWYVTSLAICGAGVLLMDFTAIERLDSPANRFFSLGLYYGIFAFGLAIALYLRQWGLVACDLFWIGSTAILLKTFGSGTSKATAPKSS
jgi:putative membrane protein